MLFYSADLLALFVSLVNANKDRIGFLQHGYGKSHKKCRVKVLICRLVHFQVI